MEKVVENGYESISLFSIKEIFYNESLRWLRDNNINTIGELMNAGYIFSGILIGDGRMYHNILVAYKLLRCKYLGLDPKMKIVDDYKIEDIEFCLSFKDSTIMALSRNQITAEELKSIIINNDEISAYNELSKMKKIGAVSAKEIVFKMSIVLDYYGKKEYIASQVESGAIDNCGVNPTFYHRMLEIGKKIDELKSEYNSLLDEMLEQMVSQETLETGKPYEKRR